MQLSREQIIQIRDAALTKAVEYSHAVVLDSNFTSSACGEDHLALAIAFGAKALLAPPAGQSFAQLKEFITDHPNDYLFGFMGYDLKNEIEDLHSENPNAIGFPVMQFFIPKELLLIAPNGEIISGEALAMEMLGTIPTRAKADHQPVSLQHKVSREAYVENVKAIREHIINGDVYELNYCIEFFDDAINIDPVAVFQSINAKNNAPFSAFLKTDDRYILCASPERFMKHHQGRLVSQPIKGTIRRGVDETDDAHRKDLLLHSEKERAENLMIVDLVRNDLAHSSETGSVKVDELFGIYTFKNLHQMISTVSSQKKKDLHPVDAIKHAFPMGSMTGAPKIKAMQLIEQFETTKRGLYSGALGYVAPGGDFDFNVVIRTIQYNATEKKVSVEVGSAITYDSDPEAEYDECLLKANTIMAALRGE